MTEEINTIKLHQRLYEGSQFTYWRQSNLHAELTTAMHSFSKVPQICLHTYTNVTLKQMKLENIYEKICF
jgi:hypothetical protein